MANTRRKRLRPPAWLQLARRADAPRSTRSLRFMRRRRCLRRKTTLPGSIRRSLPAQCTCDASRRRRRARARPGASIFAQSARSADRRPAQRAPLQSKPSDRVGPRRSQRPRRANTGPRARPLQRRQPPARANARRRGIIFLRARKTCLKKQTRPPAGGRRPRIDAAIGKAPAGRIRSPKKRRRAWSPPPAKAAATRAIAWVARILRPRVLLGPTAQISQILRWNLNSRTRGGPRYARAPSP